MSAFKPVTSCPCAFAPRVNGAPAVVGLNVCTAVITVGVDFKTNADIGEPDSHPASTIRSSFNALKFSRISADESGPNVAGLFGSKGIYSTSCLIIHYCEENVNLVRISSRIC